PLVSVMRSVYWLAISIFMVLSEAFLYLDAQSSSEEAPLAIYEKAYDSIRALGYGALMTKCALMGIFSPYQKRFEYGGLERALNRHSDGPHRDKFYLAFCFQRLSVLSEEEESLTRVEEKLNKYLTRIHSIRAAIWGCDIQQLIIELRIIKAVKR